MNALTGIPLQSTLVLASKRTFPRLRENAVARLPLLQKLDESLARHHILLCAPAGFGKTTVLAQWLHHCQKQIAWLSLDDTDNNPTRFLSSLIAALHTLLPDLGKRSLHLLQAPPVPNWEAVLILLINELAEIPHDLVLILDDYHLIHTRTVHRAVRFILEYSPPQFHLVLSSRSFPPLPLARLRTIHQLAEIDATDLRFTVEEATTFLHQTMRLSIPDHEIHRLHAYVEGWIAGLQLTAISMQHQPRETGILEQFTGEHRYLFDYLANEVLRTQPLQVQTFLFQTSFLDQLNASLCDAVLGQSNGRAILSRLEQANLFLQPLGNGRQWYRYHHLFRDFLRARLAQEPSELIQHLHKRAARWYEQQSDEAEAISHGLAARDFHWVAAQIERTGETMWTHHEMFLLHKWIQQIPRDVQRAHPRLLLLHAWSLRIMGQIPTARECFEEAEAAFRQQPTGALLGLFSTLRAAFMLVSGKPLRDVVEAYKCALSLLPGQALNWQGAVHIGLGLAYRELGDLPDASQAFATASSILLAIGNVYGAVYATAYLGQTQAEQGQLRLASSTYERAIALATRDHEAPLPIVAWPHLGLGMALLDQNALEAAAQQIFHAIHWGKQIGEKEILTESYLALAKIHSISSRYDDATALIHQAAQLAWETNQPHLLERVRVMRLHLLLQQKNIAAVSDLSQEIDLNALEPSASRRAAEYFMLTRILLAQGRSIEAQDLLAKIEGMTPPSCRGIILQLQVLQALCFEATGRTTAALELLQRVVASSKMESQRRLFLDEGQPMANLLHKALVRKIEPAYLTNLLAAFNLPPADVPTAEQTLIEPLSKAELAILNLLAHGYSNQAIADERTVTMNTIKWHLKNIYGKLGVRNRTAAVARAQALNLL
jgi:LuxR family maltose regulon positive regulatory protein